MKTLREDKPEVSFSIIRTSGTDTREGFVYDGGSFFKPAKINYVAILVKHPKGMFLFDTGLGNGIDMQYQTDMPRWKQLLLHYDPAVPARKQLLAGGYSISRIFLSHGHWDHASGIVDFPDADIWITLEEKLFLNQALVSKRLFGPAILRSQVSPKSIRWHVYQLGVVPYMGFARSYDIFSDGSAVIVPLPGHTPGSVGLILTTASGQRVFFCSDTVWNAGAFDRARPKPWLARFIADDDQTLLRQTLRQLAILRAQYPDMIFVPAHDAQVQNQFGYFPVFYGG